MQATKQDIMHYHHVILFLAIACSFTACKDQSSVSNTEPAETIKQEEIDEKYAAFDYSIENVLGAITKKIQLTPEQTQEVTKLYATYNFESVKDDNEKLREMAKKARKSLILNILTSDQRAQLAAERMKKKQN